MELITHTDERGRKYLAVSDNNGQVIIKGPPEDMVDLLYFPEPFATRLHNALFDRKIYNYQDAVRARNGLIGVLQEVLLVDAQILLEAFSKFA